MKLSEYLFYQCLKVHNQITGNTAKKLTLLILDEKIRELEQLPYDFSKRIEELRKMQDDVTYQ